VADEETDQQAGGDQDAGGERDGDDAAAHGYPSS
jgi:hypothetical protein